ncbi:MAG: cation diffusion facilitator family transporter [Lachnospiraceae bacterium]
MKQNQEKVSLTDSEKKKIAMRVSNVSIGVNILLSVGKLLAGVIAHSSAMISDAVHSASDVFSTLIVIIGIHISSKESDEEHQYGHERLECVASIILATVLGITGLAIGYQGITKIMSGVQGTKLIIPGKLALIAAIFSILVKEGLYWYTRNAAKKTKSGALMADAWHHRSDALSSIGSLVGIGAAILGFPIFDPIASVAICFCIFKVAYDIYKDAVSKMLDTACDAQINEKMEKVILAQDGVRGIDLLKTRLFGSKIYVDVEISADATLTLEASHEIAEQVHHKIEEEFEDVKHCMVHVNPYKEKIA